MLSVNLKALIEKLHPKVKEALESAAGLCMSQGQFNVEIEHWLLKTMHQSNNELRTLLRHLSVDTGKFQRELNIAIDNFKTGATRAPALSTSLVEAAQEAWMLASVEYGHHQVTSAHLLTAILLDEKLRQQVTDSAPSLRVIPPETAKTVLPQMISASSVALPQPTETMQHSKSTEEELSVSESVTPDEIIKPSQTPSLDKFTIDLTAKAKANNIDAVIGRDVEIRQVIDILTRRRQNNPLIIGEPGVGKTAVVEGFALKIAQGDVPAPLANVQLRSLDLGLLEAGASVKGEFEKRLKSVISEVKSSVHPIILFIDEAHTLIGAGGKEGQGDAANLLKPALARGELRTIAATTWAEYKKYFERDAALTRRFQNVKVEEPSEDKAKNMLRGISHSLEKHHQVFIQDEAIAASVALSKRYLTERLLPDKAISVLDTACARIALSHSATPVAIDELQSHIAQLESNIKDLRREQGTTGGVEEQLSALQAKYQEQQNKMKELTAQWQQEQSINTQIQSIREQLDSEHQNAENMPPLDNTSSDLQPKLAALIEELQQVQSEQALIQPFVNHEAVAAVIANWTGIPVGKMLDDEFQNILKLKTKLEERVIGQSHSLDAIAKAVRTSRAGLTDPRKPKGVFLFVGPSGTGKTETALALADTLYGGEQSVTVINMSEFKEEHKISMLLGSPPGYVGYGEGGVLTEAVRRKPYSVVLLDEMEKAHPGIQDVFYNLFDKGTLKDGEGRDIDFKNTIIIMTSNAAEQSIHKICSTAETQPDANTLNSMIRPDLLRHFKPAFLGRTSIIPYFPLSEEVLGKICHIALTRVAKRVKENYKAELTYDDKVIKSILARCQEVDTGARNIESIINHSILPNLATQCLAAMADECEVEEVIIRVNETEDFEFALALANNED